MQPDTTTRIASERRPRPWRSLLVAIGLIATALAAILSGGPAAASPTELYAPGAAPGDQLGSSVDRDGPWLVAGAVSDDAAGNAVGAVHVWNASGSSPNHVAELMPGDAPIGGQFGYSVAIDGDRLIAGAPFADGHRGAAYVFAWDGSAWVEEASFLAPTPGPGDWFGWSVDIDGDRVVIGAPGDDTAGRNRGAAFVFDRVGSSWALTTDLVDSTAPVNASGGYDVAIAGSEVAVGHPRPTGFGGNGPGSVTVYADGGSGLAPTVRLGAPSGFVGDNFGVALAADGGRLAVGSSGTAATPGLVHVHVRGGGSWPLADTISPTTEAGARVGFAVDLDGPLLAIGGFGVDAAGPNAGAAWLYAESGTGWHHLDTHTGAVQHDYLGRKVAVDDGHLAIGVPLRDAAAPNAGAVVVAGPAGACAAGPVIVVDELIDDDGTITPGHCSIREAVALANTVTAGATVIVPDGDYALDLPGAGPMTVTGTVTVSGDGAAVTIVDAKQASHHLQVDAGATLDLSGVTLTGGWSFPGSGGAITINGRTTITETVIDGNSATNGGAIGIGGAASSLLLERSTLANNTATQDGGAINHSSAGPVDIIDSTITGNVALQGGVMVTRWTSDTEIINTTMVGNSATDDHPGIAPVNFSTVTIENSILAGNTAPAGFDCDIAVVSAGHNLLGHCPITTAAGDVVLGSVTASTVAGPLNWPSGDPTPTMAPVAGSPALGGIVATTGGVCPAADQIGAPRPADGCDMGSVEVDPPQS